MALNRHSADMKSLVNTGIEVKTNFDTSNDPKDYHRHYLGMTPTYFVVAGSKNELELGLELVADTNNYFVILLPFF